MRMRIQLSPLVVHIEICLLVLTIVSFQRLFDPQICVETQQRDEYDQDQTKYTCNDDHQGLRLRVDEVWSDTCRRS